MKWPWVSRERYEAVVESRDLWRELHRLRGEDVSALTERLLSLKMAGAVEVPTMPEGFTRLKGIEEAIARARAAEPADEMLDLIDQRAGGNLRIRGMMLRQLAADRANKVSDEDIRAGIENGVQGSGVPS